MQAQEHPVSSPSSSEERRKPEGRETGEAMARRLADLSQVHRCGLSAAQGRGPIDTGATVVTGADD